MDMKKLENLAKKARAMGVAFLVIAIIFVIFARLTWTTFFKYVEPGKMLVVISKNGDPLPEGQLLAEKGQKGPLREVLGEGRHFIWPVIYETELHDVIEIEPGMVGIVLNKVGRKLEGKILADEGEKGIRRKVLPPGKHRLNPKGYELKDIVPATTIRAGHVGFVTSLDGKKPKGVFAEEGEKGVRRDVLQPGIYYINPKELRVEEVEVGVNQISFLERDGAQIKFPSVDGFEIDIDASVEWELHPEHVAEVMQEFGERGAIEEKVIRPQSKSISRLQGSTYGAKDFLLGEGREKFQRTFTEELTGVCQEKNVTVHTAFIRRIVIPDNLLEPIQEKFVAEEMEQTARIWEETKKSAADLQREQAEIQRAILEVEADTAALIQKVKADAEREVEQIDAQTRLAVAEKQEEIAKIEAERVETLGKADASVVQMLGEAEASGFAAKVNAFGGDAAAFARFEFADGLPRDFRVRVVHAGEGTLWTDLDKTAGVSQVSGMKFLESQQKGGGE